MRIFSTSGQWNSLAQKYGTPNRPLFELRAAPTCAPCILGFKLRQISYRVSGGNGTIALGIATDAWTGTPINPRPMAAHDEVGNNALYGLNLITEWSVYPVLPAVFLRRFSFIISGGGNTVTPFPHTVEFQRGFCLAPGTSMIIWAILVTMDVNGMTESLEISDLEVDA